MQQTPSESIQRIVAVFKLGELREGDTVFLSHSSEVDTHTIGRLARQTTWIDYPHNVLCDNPVALAFMTPEVFTWFLPAYLVMSGRHVLRDRYGHGEPHYPSHPSG